MSKSKFLEFNKYVSDYNYVIFTVEIWYEDFEYSFETRCEDMNKIIQSFKEKYNLSIKYYFNDFSDEKIINTYGISKNTNLYVKSLAPREFTFIFNKFTPGILNKFLLLKAIAYIWMGRIETGHELRLTLNDNGYLEDRLAEHIAIEFLMPEWKFNLLSKKKEFSEEWFLKNNSHFNHDLYVIRQKWIKTAIKSRTKYIE